MARPKLIVFASGTKDGSSNMTPLGFSKTESRQENLGGGGSGFENLFNATKTGVLDAEIVSVVSNNEHGGVRERAERLGVPFIYFPGPYDAEHYSSVLQKTAMSSDELWVVFSGWFKKAVGLDPQKTINIHPTLFSHGHRFRGSGMYGNRIHEAVAEALEKGEITETGCTMHFVTDEYDNGPVFFERVVPLARGMSAKDIEAAVKKTEFEWQPKITNLVVHGKIRWDGKDPKSLVVPNI